MTDDIDETPITTEDLERSYATLVGDESVTPEPPPPVQRIIEALLFVGGEPLTSQRARGIVRGLTDALFDAAIAQLNADYRRQGRPYSIQAQEHGWALTLRPRFQPIVEKLYGGVREARLSQLAIDVLSLVAYQQPVSKGEVDSMRGADSAALLRQLVRRGLIQVAAREGTDRQEVLYATTPRFMEMFALQSLDDLPKTHDLQQL